MHGRWSSSETKERLLLGQDTEDSGFKLPYNIDLRVLTADAHDIFAADILYHKRCCSSYLKQIAKKWCSQCETKIMNERKEWEVYVKERQNYFVKEYLLTRMLI